MKIVRLVSITSVKFFIPFQKLKTSFTVNVALYFLFYKLIYGNVWNILRTDFLHISKFDKNKNLNLLSFFNVWNIKKSKILALYRLEIDIYLKIFVDLQSDFFSICNFSILPNIHQYISKIIKNN